MLLFFVNTKLSVIISRDILPKTRVTASISLRTIMQRFLINVALENHKLYLGNVDVVPKKTCVYV